MSLRRIAFGSLLVATLFGSVHADAARFGANDIRSLFFVAKNENKNEIHYGIHLDKDCIPLGKEPVYGYWQQREAGPNVIEDMNMLDRTVYGIESQSIVKRSPEESKVLMTVKAASD